MWQVRELQMLASYSLNLKDVYFHKLIIGWILNTTPVMLPEWINVAWLKLSSAGVTAPDTGGVCLCRLVTVTLLPVCLCLRLPEGGWLQCQSDPEHLVSAGLLFCTTFTLTHPHSHHWRHWRTHHIELFIVQFLTLIMMNDLFSFCTPRPLLVFFFFGFFLSWPRAS